MCCVSVSLSISLSLRLRFWLRFILVFPFVLFNLNDLYTHEIGIVVIYLLLPALRAAFFFVIQVIIWQCGMNRAHRGDIPFQNLDSMFICIFNVVSRVMCYVQTINFKSLQTIHSI